MEIRLCFCFLVYDYFPASVVTFYYFCRDDDLLDVVDLLEAANEATQTWKERSLATKQALVGTCVVPVYSLLSLPTCVFINNTTTAHLQLSLSIHCPAVH